MTPPTPSLPGPVVIGALGGSGTRLIARILMESGFFMGTDLNRERDNLWFTLLFKRPRWFAEAASRDPGQLQTAMRIMEKAMVGGGKLDSIERAFLRRAVRDMVFRGHDHMRHGSGIWPFVRAFRILRSRGADPGRFRGWGWKEPNSQFYVRHLSTYFPGLKFIYVMRHGLDMAFSGNQTQLHIWGHLFGLQAPERDLKKPQTSAEFWVKASQRTIAEGTETLKERFLALNYDRLCTHPDEAIPPLLAFVGLTPHDVDMDRLRRLPVIPETMGRYRKHDLSEFTPEVLEAVRSLGFSVD